MGSKHIGTAAHSLLITCVFATATMIPAAKASIRSIATGGTACQATNGNGAKLFYFSNLYAENTSTTPQYLSCTFSDFEDDSLNNAIYANIILINPTSASFSATCVLQSGSPGATGVIDTQSLTISVPANDVDEFWFHDEFMPIRSHRWQPYTASCLIPPQARVGLVMLTLEGNFAP